MNRARWLLVERIYHAALERSPGERAAYVDAESGPDDLLRNEVLELLAHTEDHSAHMQQPIAALAGALCAPSVLRVGQHLGGYRIDRWVGSGGMGDVYQAKDTTLGRDVALKILPVGVTTDPARVARFRREARILASLNHPGIGAIHGLEHADGMHFFVLELVDGGSLADRVKEGRLSIEEVLRLSEQIAEAVATAHGKGIIHRDLKPANIGLTTSGRVKVLDFGIAELIDSGQTADAAVDSQLAAPIGPASSASIGSVFAGTPAYMSPEQARGVPADQRADVWAFGCVLYELLSGRRAFPEANTLTAAARSDPAGLDWSAIEETPPALTALLRRCLQVDPAERPADCAVVQHAIAQISRSGRVEQDLAPSGGADTATGSGHTRTRLEGTRAVAITFAGTLLVASVAAFVLLPGWWRGGFGAPGALRKFEVMVEGLGEMPGTYVGESGPGAGVSISPDGRRIVYPREGRLWIRELSQLESRPLDGTNGAVAPTWSPDGESLAFVVGAEVKRISAASGLPVSVTAASTFVETGALSWSADGLITFTTGNGPINEVAARGGNARLVLAAGPGERDFHDLVPLPGLRGTLVITHLSDDQYAIDALERGVRRRLFGPRRQVIRHAVYSSTGHLLYQRVDRSPGVWAVPVDPTTFVATGEPFLVAPSGLRPSLARDGTLVFVTDELWGLERLSLVDRSGRSVRSMSEPVRGLRQPALSPDGTRVAVVRQGAEHDDIWIFDVNSGQPTQVTFDGVRGDPAWDPGGRQIVYSCGATSREGGTCFAEADGVGTPRVIVPGGSMASFVPDGRALAHVLFDPRTRTDIWRTTLTTPPVQTLLTKTEGFDFSPRVSPDGRFLAYGTTATGPPEVFVTAFPEPRARWQVSPGSGAEPQWNPAGHELFFVDATGRLQSVPFDAGAQMPLGTPSPLFAETASNARLTAGYSPGPDGQTFVVLRDADRAQARPRITVVQNWFAEFRGSRGGEGLRR